MSTDIVESLPERKHAPAAAAPAKGKPEAKNGGSAEEGSEKRIRQAVYDIRYRARREDIDLKAAYSQYMSNSNLSQQERAAVREKLFGKEGGGVKEQFTVGADEMATSNLANALYKVFVEDDQVKELELAYLSQLDESSERKYKVRVTDKNGKSYVRYATRAKITELRQNPNIKSVEMTEHGDPYEGEKKKGEQTAKTKRGLDPVGKEDSDVDNDGDVDKSDKYLLKRRKAIGNSIRGRASKKIKEDYLADATVTTEPKGRNKVTGEDVDNYKSGSIKVSDGDSATKIKRGMQYASFAHQELFSLISEKKACDAKKKKKAYSEATVNTPECEKKPESKEKDMRGYYAKINVIKNKIRAQGVKNPMVLADPDDVEKSWDKDKKKDDDVKEGMWYKDKAGKQKYVDPRVERARKKYGDPKDKVDGSKERTAADPGMTGRMGGPKTKKPTPKVTPGKNADGTRYNPFTKDGKTKKGDRTPTSASQTTAP